MYTTYPLVFMVFRGNWAPCLSIQKGINHGHLVHSTAYWYRPRNSLQFSTQPENNLGFAFHGFCPTNPIQINHLNHSSFQASQDGPQSSPNSMLLEVRTGDNLTTSLNTHSNCQIYVCISLIYKRACIYIYIYTYYCMHVTICMCNLCQHVFKCMI